MTGIYFTPEQKKRHIDLLPQVVETNTPRPMDVAGEGLLYDERVIRVYLADALTEEHSALDLRLFDLKLQ